VIKTVKWKKGNGYITITYSGLKDDIVVIESDANTLFEDREQTITFSTLSLDISKTVKVTQKGIIVDGGDSSGNRTIIVDGGVFSPVKITNLEEFNNVFGGQSASFFGPGIVKSIFDEAGNAPVTMYLARVVGSGSVVASGTGSLSGDATMTVKAGYKGKEDPGVWANGIEVSLYSYSSRVKGMFTLVVTYGGKQETYSYGTLSEIQTAVNKVSKYIVIEFSKEIEQLTYKNITGTVTATTSSNEVTGEGTTFKTDLAVGNVLYDSNKKIIGTVASITSDTKLVLTSKAMNAVTSATVSKRDDKVYTASLSGGVDGEVQESDFYPIESTTDPKGLSCFDGYDVQIIACTEFHSLSMAKVLNEYLKTRKNPIGIVNMPLNADEGTAELYALELQTNETSFLSGYMGWCKIPDENGNPVLIPAIGPILGAAYVRTPIPIFVTLRFSFSKDFFRDEFNKQDSSYFLFSNKYKESVFKDNVFQ
jgi:hypothetical protein